MSLDLLLERALFLVGFAIVGLVLARLLRVEHSLGCLAAGVLAGLLLPVLHFDTGIRASNFEHIVFLLILPLLIFSAAWNLRLRVLRRWLAPILLLAVAGVVVSAAITGALVYAGIGHPEAFPWQAALLTGAILAATDPASVTAKLEQLNAPEELGTIVEGESLLNDAAAVVLFAVVLVLAQGDAAQAETEAARQFAVVFFGGALLGVLLGLVAAILVLAAGSVSASPLILTFAALASFFVAQEVLGVSGIIAVTLAALTSNRLLQEQREGLVSEVASNLEWLRLLLESLLFTLMGLVITWDMFREMWLAMLIAIGAATAARFAAVYGCNGASALLGQPLDRRWSLLMSWGGLRGAVAIALVLALPTSLPYWWLIQSMVFAVVLFSLLAQGTSSGLLLRKLGLDER